MTQFASKHRFYPSSKNCSICGHWLDELQLDVWEWTCPKCGAVHDRDINAAINIGSVGFIHPEDTEGVRVFGVEGASPAAVSARIRDLLTDPSGTYR